MIDFSDTTCEAVMHHSTGRLNGWCLLPGMASQEARYFRDNFPGEKFSVVRLLDPKPGENIAIHDGLYLDPFKPVEQGPAHGHPEALHGRLVFAANADPAALPAILVLRSRGLWSATIGDPWRYSIDSVMRATREHLMSPKLRTRWPDWAKAVGGRSKMELHGTTGIFHAPESIAREAVEIMRDVFPGATVSWPKGVKPNPTKAHATA